jgi:hypothetical protein
MAIQAFIDDSGGKGQGRVATFAGFIAEAETFLRFSEEWASTLDRAPRIRCFKMRDAVALSGQFRGWTEVERDSKVRTLCEVIKKFQLMSIYCVTDLKAFERLWGHRAPIKYVNHPYFWPFYYTLFGVRRECLDQGQTRPFEIVFDEHAIFAPRVKKWYPLMRFGLEELKEPERPRLLPDELLFRRDEDVMPLQAADLLAWAARVGWSAFSATSEDVHYQAAIQWGWLYTEIMRWPSSRHSTVLTPERLESDLQVALRYDKELMADATTHE